MLRGRSILSFISQLYVMGGFSLPIFLRMHVQCVPGSLLAAVTAHAAESLGTRLVSGTHKIALCPTLWRVSVHDLYAAVSNTKQQPKEL